MSQATTSQGILAHAAIHPTLSVTDIARAREFYEGKLGLPVIKADDMGGLRLSVGSGQLYIYTRADPPKAENTVASFEVPNLDEAMIALRAKGISFEDYDFPGMKTVNGVLESGDMRGSWFLDPDGNTLGLFEA